MAAVVGYPLVPATISSFDVSTAKTSVAGSTTVTLTTQTGKGSADVVIQGDGDVDVTVKYSVDGGADTTIGTSDKAAYIALGFTTSLAIKVVNGNVGAKNQASVSVTGVKQ